MSYHYQATMPDGKARGVDVHDVPDECPLCHYKGVFRPLYLFFNDDVVAGHKPLEVIYRCSNKKCYEVFIGYYVTVGGNLYALTDKAPARYEERIFSETIQDISREFSPIYNQALRAETDGLDQICGPGYRKSLEFLIKDYLLSKAADAEEKEAIKKEFLGVAISTRIQDLNIKGVAKRATWLGNDETHYTRKWEQKDMQDLKKLIDLTVHWIEAEALTTELFQDMPEGK